MTRRAGQIVKRGERRWLVRVYRGQGPTGRRRYENRTVQGTKRDAEDALAEMRGKLRRGRLPERTRMELGEWLEFWLEHIAQRRLRAHTAQHYREMLNRYVRGDPGAPNAIWTMRLQQIRTQDVQALVTRLQNRPRKLSARTIIYVHAILSGAFKSALRQGKIESNPAEHVELSRRKGREMRALASEEAPRLLEAAAASRYAAFFVLALDTGARPGEFRALSWEDCDLEKGEIRIRRTLPRLRAGEPVRFEDPKTEKSRRTLAILPSTVRALVAHRARRAAERMALLAGPIPAGELVFVTAAGRHVEERNLVNRHFKPALARAGLPRSVRLYDLRHTTATALLMRNVPVNVVSARLGHASAKMTLDVYGHVLPEAQPQVESALEAFLRSS